jgi:glycosyltransferase involved in cell wall biosynthesis
VLFVSGEYPPLPGGISDYTALLRDALGARGVATLVLAGNGAAGDGVSALDRWGWHALAAVGDIVRRERPDLIHVQYQAGAFGMHPVANLMPRLLRRELRLPVVTTFHDLRPPYLFPKAGPLRSRLMRRMARDSAAAIVTNPEDERALAKHAIETTRIPIGPNIPAPSRGIRALPRTVAFFGFPARSKGILELISALGAIAEGERPTLALVGDDGRPSRGNDVLARSEIDAAADAAGVALTRTGFLEPQAASDALARAAAIVLPFRDGASPRSGSLLAALQSGRPVLACEPDQVRDLGELADLPQLMLVPREVPGVLRSFIQYAMQRCVKPRPLPTEFHWSAIAERHVELYEAVLDRRRS